MLDTSNGKIINVYYIIHSHHATIRPFAVVVRIRLLYHKDRLSNRCCVTFSSCEAEKYAQAAATLFSLGERNFKTELILWVNVVYRDDDNCVDVFAA